MTETRGRPTSTVRVGGGAVRRIEPGALVECFETCFQRTPSSKAIADLKERLAGAAARGDNVPLMKRDHQKRLQDIEKHAKALASKLFADSKMADLLLQIEWEPSPIGSSNALAAWLTRLQNLDHFLDPFNPSEHFSQLYRDIAQIIESEGIAVTVSPSSNFVSFLNAVDGRYPLLVFAEKRAPQSRYKLVERALQPVRQ